MSIRFTKMHALGNDFMVIDAVNQTIHLTDQSIRALAQRHTGVGFDQCLIVEPSNRPNIDFFYRIYNADGSEVGQCGNGARCLARFIQYYGLSHKNELTIATQTTQMSLKIHPDTVTVEFPRPQWKDSPDCLTIDHSPYHFYTIDLGNPHAVLLSSGIQQAPVQTIGQQLSTHSFFPNQCNVGFMEFISTNQVHCRVYERGCGETQACGSGAVAAAAIGMLHYGLESDVTVHLPGGTLRIRWPDRDGPIFLTGGSTFVYEGVLLTLMNQSVVHDKN